MYTSTVNLTGAPGKSDNRPYNARRCGGEPLIVFPILQHMPLIVGKVVLLFRFVWWTSHLLKLSTAKILNVATGTNLAGGLLNRFFSYSNKTIGSVTTWKQNLFHGWQCAVSVRFAITGLHLQAPRVPGDVAQLFSRKLTKATVYICPYNRDVDNAPSHWSRSACLEWSTII